MTVAAIQMLEREKTVLELILKKIYRLPTLLKTQNYQSAVQNPLSNHDSYRDTS